MGDACDINIDSIIFQFIFGKQSDISSTVTKVLEYCNKLTKLITSESEREDRIKLLYKVMYALNYLYKAIGLLLLVRETPELKQIDNVLGQYYSLFFSNDNIKKCVTQLQQKSKNVDELFFFGKILKKFEQIQNETNKSFNTNVNICKNKIEKILRKDALYETSKIKKYVNNVPNEIVLNKQNYYYLLKKVKEPSIRNDINKLYSKKVVKCLKLLEDMLILRHDYAVQRKSDSYFGLLKHKTFGEISDTKVLINDLIKKIEQRSRKEIERIKRELEKDMYSKKVDVCDIIFYYEKLKTKHKFSPNMVLNTLFDLVSKYFGIVFRKITSGKIWSNTPVDTYEVTNIKKKNIGIVYFDLLKNTDKKIISPSCVHLCQTYVNLTMGNKTDDTKMVLVAGYDSMEANCMTYNDVVSLFREIGTCIQKMAYDTTNGIYYDDQEFSTLMPDIMEYMAWDKATLEIICRNLDKSVIDHILFTKYIDYANSMELKCVNAMFDHIIHNSPDLVNLIKGNLSANKNDHVLLVLYKNIYKDVMGAQEDIMDINIACPAPLVIYQEINGSEGLLYFNILIEVLSYGIYYKIKNGVKTNEGANFVEILNTYGHSVRKGISDFASDIDNYGLYLQEIIGYSEVDTETNSKIKERTKETITESTVNKFDENVSGSDEDVENIIQIDRELNP